MARRWDVETGKLLLEQEVHNGVITDMQVSPDGTHALTSSKDKTAKIIDMETLQILRVYQHTRPVNSAAMSPLDHVCSTLLAASSRRRVLAVCTW
jgi:translation initiation factor 3 subunit I